MTERFCDRWMLSKKVLEQMVETVSYTTLSEAGSLVAVIRCERSRWVSYGRRSRWLAIDYFVLAMVIALGSIFNWTSESALTRLGGFCLALVFLSMSILKVRWCIWRCPGQERIIIDESTLTIERRALRMARRKSWSLADGNVRLQLDCTDSSLKGPAYLCMDTGFRVHTFAHNLSETDARQLLAEIQAFWIRRKSEIQIGGHDKEST